MRTDHPCKVGVEKDWELNVVTLEQTAELYPQQDCTVLGAGSRTSCCRMNVRSRMYIGSFRLAVDTVPAAYLHPLVVPLTRFEECLCERHGEARVDRVPQQLRPRRSSALATNGLAPRGSKGKLGLCGEMTTVCGYDLVS
ncbi:hypothetical protein GGTG_12663 [Gaeumannomyces tritici R3-111a-1]|uniref:Uncharacterized protein n=1 Tax=Gaeumannomyces tritici (strain R3-111a-1) TaxID=644352 RepID=J3PGN4_GAET3|nr:hypothetical protein GGTG_12663 [Gaeumannomyces tritici R3-111a-1]EJT69780.1 hypothetical protein GGTG_12663 [Gaeumannomyces tritici R3-111a-1]